MYKNFNVGENFLIRKKHKKLEIEENVFNWKK